MKVTIKVTRKELKSLMKKKPHGNEASSQNSKYLLDIVKNGLLDDAISLSNFSKVLHCSDEKKLKKSPYQIKKGSSSITVSNGNVIVEADRITFLQRLYNLLRRKDV